MNKLLLLLALGLAFLAAPVAASIDESTYVPSEEIDRFHWQEFDASVDYAKDIGIKRIAPWIIVGIVIVITFLIWSCCRCCHCGCCDHSYDMSSTTRNVLAVVAVLCAVAGVIILIYGFKADEVQRDAVTSLPELFQNVIDWKNDFQNATGEISDACALLQVDLNDIEAEDPGHTYVSASDIQDIRDALTEIDTQASDISTTLDDTDFESMKTDYADTASKYDDYRHLAVIILFSVCLGFLLVQIVFALMNAYATEGCKPANCCCCLQPIITGIHLLLIFLAFIISALLFGVATGLADFCIDADANLLTSVGLDSEEVAVYYITCDTDHSIQNPIYNQTQEIGEMFNYTRGNVTTWRDDAMATPSCESIQDCIDIVTILNSTLVHIDQLEVAVGTFDSQQNAYTTGVLRLVDCPEVNGKYQAVLNSTCGTLFDSIRRTFIVMVLFAFVMVLAEILYRCLGDAHRKLDDKFDGKDMPMEPVKGGQDPPPYKPTPNGWNRV